LLDLISKYQIKAIIYAIYNILNKTQKLLVI